MDKQEPLPKRRFNRTTFQRVMLKWHARIGAIAALFILVLTITGLMLNHQDLLGIHGSDVSADWVLDWYYGDVDSNARPQTIPLSRVMLDIHTGNFFGISGTLMMDLASILLLFLVGSGLYNWIKRKRW